MYYQHSILKYLRFFIFSFLILLVSCATKTEIPKTPTNFDTAIRALVNNLLEQVRKKQFFLEILYETKIVIDPFIDANSGEVVYVSRQIEQIFLEESSKNFNHLLISRISPETFNKAQYVISGIMYLDDYQEGSTSAYKKNEKYYHVNASIVSLKTGKIVSDSSIWISDRNLDYTPVPFYKDSPFYVKDRRTEGLIATAEASVGLEASKEYYESLDTQALLVKAEGFYEEKNYEQAALLFNKASERLDGQFMKTYAGLYETNLKLKQEDKAGKAFIELLKLSVKEHNKFNLKFLFAVNSAAFINDADLRKEYSFWLRMIREYFKNNNQCFHIVGHCSRSGTEAYNDSLSFLRAQSILQRLHIDFPSIIPRSKVTGKGFRENIVGSGTDDERDAIDRRVEILVVDCSQI